MLGKLKLVADFLVNTIGLHYPRELTSASIIGVVFAAHVKPLTYHQAHDYLEDFKGYFKDER